MENIGQKRKAVNLHHRSAHHQNSCLNEWSDHMCFNDVLFEGKCGPNHYESELCRAACGYCTNLLDGHWGDWSPWSSCTSTCGLAIQKRTRQCDNPPPTNGGQVCHGPSDDSALCTLSPCIYT
ncbi:hypothetical protein CHS0354_020276 [Potamilus streckersoni]|uniref:Uncharacterized protein n=1 Tax=Potamilus streckersoni TaxID=2493646 RepID=A0AAE0S5U4_9BIVA|nr:hypothetical protein CHS0354_020276 [Potamilus streckersoni]